MSTDSITLLKCNHITVLCYCNIITLPYNVTILYYMTNKSLANSQTDKMTDKSVSLPSPSHCWAQIKKRNKKKKNQKQPKKKTYLMSTDSISLL